MRTRIVIGVCTASIIFGGMAYAGYEIDGHAIANQQPKMINGQPVPSFQLVAAEQAQEFPGDNGNQSMVIPSVKNAPQTTNSQSQNLFSYPTTEQPVLNSAQPTQPAANPLNPPVSQKTPAAMQGNPTNPASSGMTSPAPVSNPGMPGAATPQTMTAPQTMAVPATHSVPAAPVSAPVTSLPAATKPVMQTSTSISTNVPAVDETYIPAPAVKTVPVNLPNQTNADVSQGNAAYSDSVKAAPNPYAQMPNQSTDSQPTAYEHQSFSSVPTPVYFSSNSGNASGSNDVPEVATTTNATPAQNNTAAVPISGNAQPAAR